MFTIGHADARKDIFTVCGSVVLNIFGTEKRHDTGHVERANEKPVARFRRLLANRRNAANVRDDIRYFLIGQFIKAIGWHKAYWLTIGCNTMADNALPI